MEKWQILYTTIVGLGFGVGWLFSPIIGVVFVWVSVILSEILDYRRRMREFDRKSE